MSVCFSHNSEQLIGWDKSCDKLKFETFISNLSFAWSVFDNNLMVLLVSFILSFSLSELPETFTLRIKSKFRKIKTEKLELIVVVVILKTC